MFFAGYYSGQLTIFVQVKDFFGMLLVCNIFADF